jgi:REP element-mobilizing transposase RayT
MRLSEYGRIADACWRAIPRHFRHAGLGAFVIMPNHVHGILVLEAFYGKRADPVGARQVVPETQADGVLTWAHHGAPLRTAGRIPQAVAGSLGAIIRQYKSSVTREVRAETGRTGPFWQRNYYEHVIRSEFEWWRLHRYIESNPMTWAQDEENAARADIAVADRGSRRS